MHTVIGNQIAGYRNNDSFMVCFAHPVKLMYGKDRNFININVGALIVQNVLPVTNEFLVNLWLNSSIEKV
jgi:hypothetical protein